MAKDKNSLEEPTKIYVKLQDPTGSFYIASQGVSVNRAQIVEVEKDTMVETALRNKGIVEATKKEYDEYHAARNKALEDAGQQTANTNQPKDKPAKNVALTLDGAKGLIKTAIEKGKVTVDGEKHTFNGDEYDTEAELAQELVDNAKLLAELKKAIK